MSERNEQKQELAGRNKRVVLICSGVFVGMIGMAYAAVPLYDMFCRVTGFGGTTQVADVAPEEILERTVTVRFDSNTNEDLPWEFKPVQISMDIRIGETGLAFYRARNMSDRTITGTATFNVTPDKAGIYFNKVDCFCFTEQVLKPGESIDMPVTFFVDPEIDLDKNAREVNTITLSYTFFEVETDSAPQAGVSTPETGLKKASES